MSKETAKAPKKILKPSVEILNMIDVWKKKEPLMLLVDP